MFLRVASCELDCMKVRCGVVVFFFSCLYGLLGCGEGVFLHSLTCLLKGGVS